MASYSGERCALLTFVLLTLYLDKKSRTVYDMKTIALDFFFHINWEDALWKHRTLRGSQSYLYLTLARPGNKRQKCITINIFLEGGGVKEVNIYRYLGNFVQILTNSPKNLLQEPSVSTEKYKQKNINNLFLSQFSIIRLLKLANYWLTCMVDIKVGYCFP